nr:immunoglobulin light chain junction region [Macaca mulatta]MOW56396.1 immunoglobulin light chain junction region [Macaca mulatta]MOW56725.1 immunoglobulin light chain junction region [Macaca mulatta]MOW56834.1 immunoglobulin light chain junction region [Macaca mulatta]MOW56859.1 immunoglobulin light chain junction region [Macaca mulatta]
DYYCQSFDSSSFVF